MFYEIIFSFLPLSPSSLSLLLVCACVFTVVMIMIGLRRRNINNKCTRKRNCAHCFYDYSLQPFSKCMCVCQRCSSGIDIVAVTVAAECLFASKHEQFPFCWHCFGIQWRARATCAIICKLITPQNRNKNWWNNNAKREIVIRIIIMPPHNGNRNGEKHTPDKIVAKCDLLIDIDTFESRYTLANWIVHSSTSAVFFFFFFALARQFLIDLVCEVGLWINTFAQEPKGFPSPKPLCFSLFRCVCVISAMNCLSPVFYYFSLVSRFWWIAWWLFFFVLIFDNW